MARMDDALADAGLDDVRMLLQVHDELVFEVPDGARKRPRAVIRDGDGERRRAGADARRAARMSKSAGANIGAPRIDRPTCIAQPAADAPDADMATLARGGRINFFGFVLRLVARLPFLFIAGRIYGAEALGRFAYAVLIVEFAAQLAAFGLRRGLAQQLANATKPHACVVADAMLVAAIGSAIGMTILGFFPQAMFPNSPVYGLDWLLPVTVIRDRLDRYRAGRSGLSQRCRRDGAGAIDRRAMDDQHRRIRLSYYSLRDGLIISYVDVDGRRR